MAMNALLARKLEIKPSSISRGASPYKGNIAIAYLYLGSKSRAGDHMLLIKPMIL